MGNNDWLVGRDRRSEAADRIYSAASDLISRQGFDAFTIDALAAKIHCSPATIYRQVGGKTVILEGILHRYSMRIVEAVRESITGLSGSERIVTAILVALRYIRAEPLGPLVMGSIRPDGDNGWLTSSPLVVELAEEMVGRIDTLAAQWLIRVTFALWYWPVQDAESEREIVQRFVGPSFAAKDA